MFYFSQYGSNIGRGALMGGGVGEGFQGTLSIGGPKVRLWCHHVVERGIEAKNISFLFALMGPGIPIRACECRFLIVSI